MKKSTLIILLVTILVLIAAGAIYYFYFYQNGYSLLFWVEDSSIETVAEEVESEKPGDEDIDEGVSIGESEPAEEGVEEFVSQEGDMTIEGEEFVPDGKEPLDSDIESEGESDTEEVVPEEEEGEDVEKEISVDYSYRNVFRNPFRQFRQVQSEKVLTLAEIKSMVPFEIKGIIGNNYGRLVVIQHQGQTRIIRKKTEIDDFWIIDILEDGLILLYKGVQFKLEMESDIGGL